MKTKLAIKLNNPEHVICSYHQLENLFQGEIEAYERSNKGNLQ